MSEPTDDHTDFEPKGNQPDVINSEARRIRVNAGAGTGKTSTMIGKIDHHIRNDGAVPDRILALTYTNKAGHNIESRLADELDSGAGYNVSAYNYHSFCNQILKDYAYFTDHPPDFELVTNQSFSNYLPDIIDECDFEFLNPMSPGGNGQYTTDFSELKTFISKIKRARFSPAEVREALPPRADIHRAQAAVQDIHRQAELLGDFDTIFDLPDWDERDAQLVTWLEELADMLEAFATEFADEGQFLAEISTYLSELQEVIEELVAIYESGEYIDGKLSIPSSFFTDRWSPKYFEGFKQNLFTRLQEYVNVYRRTYDFAEGYEVYERLLDERNALDYEDLIHETINLLEDDVVGEELKSEWDYVYCDEFQDTHAAELDLIEAIAENANLLIIGDTDQSIYEWRGADPENLDEVTEIFDEMTSIDLNLNFRSYQGILDLTDHLGHTDSLEAHRGRNHNEVVRVSGKPDREAQSEQVATAVSRLIRGQFPDIEEYDNGDIAIITRTNSQARDVATQLEAESIPFSISTNQSEDQPPGIETVLAYFRFLVDTDDEISLSRILLHLYGVPETDLQTLHTQSDSLWVALQTTDEDSLEAPASVQRAVSDITDLQTVRKTNSLSGFYEQFRDITKIEWYLTPDERRELAQLENKIEGYDDEGVQSMLSEDFVSHLDLQSTLEEQADQTQVETADKSENKVNLLTIHRAKGLDFDVVLLPFLSDDEWLTTPGSYAATAFEFEDLVETRLETGGTDWLTADRSDLSEDWRTLHVAITRAKDHLFMFGHHRREGFGDDHIPAVEMDKYLPSSIDWSFGGSQMNLWQALEDSYEAIKDTHPESVTDVTEFINEGLNQTNENLLYYGNQVEPGEAEATVLEYAKQLRENNLDAEDPTAFDLYADPGGVDRTVSLAREHSHSSIETFKDCPRRHYLDHVVYAYEDELEDPDVAGTDNYIDSATVGTLFHEVAEEAYWRKYSDQTEWEEALGQIQNRFEASDAECELAKDAIDRYFETALPEWEQLAAEWPFILDDYLDGLGGNVKGFVDGVFRKPSGELVVLDYKTTKEKKSIQESYQLLLYFEGVNEYLDDSQIDSAGYVYVGEAGPDIDLYTPLDLLDYKDELERDLRAADTSDYANYSNGDICADCLHHSLGCAAPEYERADDRH